MTSGSTTARGTSILSMESKAKVGLPPHPSHPSPEDLEKKEEEVAEKEFEDELMTTHYFKLPGEYLYLIGKDWPSYDVLQLETQS